MASLVRLKLIGITYNQIESGVYAVVLQQQDGTRRLPIVIGAAEAQAIECHLQRVHTPRPLTHDLMVGLLKVCGLTLEKVVIKQLPPGMFGADLYFRRDNGEMMIVDSRSSDGLALAIRVDCPIYTDEAVLVSAGFAIEESRAARREARLAQAEQQRAPKDLAQLEQAMQKAAAEENYEEAARLKSEIDKLKNGEK